jgi:26S proteasome regulatory subunit T1
MRSSVGLFHHIRDNHAHYNAGVKESDTGLAPPNLWDVAADRQRIGEEGPLQVARCTKIIPVDPDKKAAAEAVNPLGGNQGQKGADEQDKYVINIKQIAKFVVGLADRVAPTDIEEGMRVGCVHSALLLNSQPDVS